MRHKEGDGEDGDIEVLINHVSFSTVAGMEEEQRGM